MKLDEKALEAAARIHHERCEQFCFERGDVSQTDWDDLALEHKEEDISDMRAAITAYFKTLEADGLAAEEEWTEPFATSRTAPVQIIKSTVTIIRQALRDGRELTLKERLLIGKIIEDHTIPPPEQSS